MKEKIKKLKNNKIINKKLQKLILRIIKENNGTVEWRVIKNKATINYWERGKAPESVDVIIKHQLDLLGMENKILRKENLPEIFYIITQYGHQEFDPFWIKVMRFILYDKNNLFILFTLIIAIVSLIISIFALKN